MRLRYFPYTFCFLVVLFIPWPQAQAQQGAENPNIRAAWEAFSENRLEDARDLFARELTGEDADLAQLGTSLVESAYGNKKSLGHYLEFCKLTDDPTMIAKAMWSIRSGELEEDALEFVEMMLDSDDGTLRARAAQSLGSHYLAMNERSKAERAFAMTGAVAEWMLLGEFENISESGFDRDYGVLEKPWEGSTFINKRGVEVTWFELKQPRIDNWVDFEYHFYTQNALYYAQTICQSPVEQEVQFRLGVSGSVKVWVNDKLMFSESQERDNGLDSYIFTVNLKEGNNRILLQVGTSETDGANFMLRITDDAGFPIPDLSFVLGPESYPDNYDYESRWLEDEIEAYFLRKVEEHPGYIENYITLGQYYLMADQVFNARTIIREARSRFPDCSYITFQLINANARAENATEVSLLIEELKTKDPESALSLSLLYDEAIEIEDFEEAERLLAIIEEREGVTANVLNKRVSLAFAQDRNEDVLELAQMGYELFPENATFVQLKNLIEVNVEKDIQAGRRALKKYLKDRYDVSVVLSLIDSYFQAGDVNDGLDLYRELVSNHPLATGYYSRLASICFSLDRQDEAEEYLQECTRIAPYVGSYYKSLGENYRDIGNQQLALKYFRKALELDPYDYESREQIRLARNSGGTFNNFEEPDIEQLYDQAPGAETYPDHHSIILLNETQKIVYEGGGSEERRYLAVKVLNNRGVDFWKEYNIYLPGNQEGFIIESKVLKQNGSSLEAQNNGGHIVFSNLEPGDAILLSYQIRDYYSGELIGHFWDKHHFQYFLPVEKSRYALMVPEGKQFDYLVDNGEVEEEVTEVLFGRDRYKRYQWTSFQVPALEDESYMPDLVDVGITLHLSSFPDWEYIANWYANLARAKSKPNLEVDLVVSDLFEEDVEYTDRETVEMIYDYILENIRYSSVPFLQSGLVPQKASRVVSSRLGDCKDVSTLFVAMCAARGIDANLVLINTRDNGRKDLMLPSISFNHCIAEVELDGERYYAELTADNLPFSSGEMSVKNAFALPVRAENDGVEAFAINAETRIVNDVVRETEVSFEGDMMIVSTINKKSGTAAYNMRTTYEGIGEEARLEEMQEAVNGDYPNIKVRSVSFSPSLEDNSPTLEYEYEYQVPDVFMSIGSLKIVKLPWSDPFSTPDFLAADERVYDIEIWAFVRYEAYDQTLNIAIPEDMKLSEVPEDVRFDTPYFFYEMTFELTGNTLTASRIFFLKEERIPGEKFGEFKEIMSKIVKTDEMRIAFEPVSP